MCAWQVLANSRMDVDVVIKSEAADFDCLSGVNASLTATSVDSYSSPELSSVPVPATPDDNQSSSQESSTADRVVDALTALSEGLLPTFVAATPKVIDSTAGPIKLVVAANSSRPVVPKASSSAQVHLPASGLGHPTLLVGPAVTAPVCVTSPRRTVTVLPASVRSPSQSSPAVVTARPLTAAGPTVSFAARSPAKVTVLSLPKTSSVPGQFVTVVPNSSSATAVTNNKTTTTPYKVLLRPPSAVSV